MNSKVGSSKVLNFGFNDINTHTPLARPTSRRTSDAVYVVTDLLQGWSVFQNTQRSWEMNVDGEKTATSKRSSATHLQPTLMPHLGAVAKAPLAINPANVIVAVGQ